MATLISTAQAALFALLDGTKGSQNVSDLDRSSPLLSHVKAGSLFKAVKDLISSIDTTLNGGAASGVASPQVKFTVAQAAGALAAPTVPVVLELTIADGATGNVDFTGLPGKHKVIDFKVKNTAASDAGNSHQLQTGAGAAVSDAVAPGANVGDFKGALNFTDANIVFASGATIRVRRTRAAASAAAVCTVWLVPVA